MNKIFCILILALVSLSSHADETSGTLIIQINGMLNDEGLVVANLFREGDDVMKIDKVYLQSRGLISDKHALLIFQNLQYGKYAVSAFHDENGNGTLDHNMLHMPAEPLGFSNGFKLGIFTGLPSFEKLKFVFKPGTGIIDIIVK